MQVAAFVLWSAYHADVGCGLAIDTCHRGQLEGTAGQWMARDRMTKVGEGVGRDSKNMSNF